jgi:hypothetical protein
MTPAEYRTRCRIAERCLPPAVYRALLTQLHDDMLGVIAMDEALLKQALEALETPIHEQPLGMQMSIITALRERLK